jgi:hypothetical protein
MIWLERRSGEGLMVGDEVEVVLGEVTIGPPDPRGDVSGDPQEPRDRPPVVPKGGPGGGWVGIQAPREIEVLRRELWRPGRVSLATIQGRIPCMPWGYLWQLSRKVTFDAQFQDGPLYLSEGSRVVGVVVPIKEYDRLRGGEAGDGHGNPPGERSPSNRPASERPA